MLTLKQVAQWCDGSVFPEFANLEVTGVSIDSRSIQPGELFVAIQGENFDGHIFVRQALEKGAGAVMTHKQMSPDIPAVFVDNTLEALGALARGYRISHSCEVIGITGSVGKTTTKEMIADILATTYKTCRTQGNHNNNVGLPLSILGMRDDCEMMVLEMGMNHFREMSYLSSIAQPNLALINNIGTMHIEHLGSRQGILTAKMEILEGLKSDGKIVFNGDEPLLWNQREQLSRKPVYFGIENTACDVCASNIEQADGGVYFRVTGLGQEFDVFVPSEGMHIVYDALAAVTVGLEENIRPERIQEALAQFQNTGSRQSIYEKNGFTIIEDCYNAGPESMKAGLTVLADRPSSGRKIAVLGDMLELGTLSVAEHYKLGRLAAEKADLVFAYGPHSDRVIIGAITGGVNNKNAMRFDTHEALASTLRRMAKPGDVLLFKGSRGMKMEKALELFFQESE